MKIKSIEIKGFRGIRNCINFSLDSVQSVLLYGDNGSGKSSVTDAIEWFYYDQVEHLSKKEIGNRGIPALRNIFLSNDEDAYIELKFTDSKIDTSKKLFLNRENLTNEYSNTSAEFQNYKKASQKENLILRYKDLLKFILYTPSKRVEELSDIIGFSEVTKIKAILKRAVNNLRKEIKIKNIRTQISTKQALILEQIGQNINTDVQYFGAIKELITPLNLPVEIKDDPSIEKALELIKKPEDEKTIRLQVSYQKVVEALSNMNTFLENIRSSYKSFYDKYQSIRTDTDRFRNISLEKLLSEGLNILEKNLFEDDRCPLCLHPKNREELIEELRKRIEELSAFKKEKEEMEEEKKNTQQLLQNLMSEIEILLKEESLSIEENEEIKEKIEQIRNSIHSELESITKITISTREDIKRPDEVSIVDFSIVQDIISTSKKRMEKITSAKKDDEKFSISQKIVLVRQAYSEIKSLKREAEIVERQLQSMQLICNEFTKRQKEVISSFLKSISADINEFYLYMNPSEEVDEIELIPIEKDDELIGVTIQYKFHGEEVSPPEKYLSESHLNCLGICLFMASVKAFNQINKFFILDDVISSFDTAHRLKFASLLKEKFADYQIFLFTHEKNWYEYVANVVKGQHWFTTEIRKDNNGIVYLETPPLDLKNRIEQKIAKSDPYDLGNMIRRYLERLLKEICFELEVKVKFLFNEKNEKRMPAELLSELRSHLKKKIPEIKDAPVLDRVGDSKFIGDSTSHDSSFTESISDLKTFYNDIIELENLFTCDVEGCGRKISKRYYDPVEKLIRCKCGNKKYRWKE